MKAKNHDKTEAMVSQGETALAAIPDDLMEFAGAGTEAIGQNDVRPPRLVAAQANSPQVKKIESKYIEGLREGDLFNDLTSENYGDGSKEPLEFVVVKSLGARAMELRPLDEGGGIIDRNVPLDDPRCQWTTDEEGKRVKPIATKFYDYLLWLPKTQELVAFSLKSTQLKVAIQINSLIKQPLRGELFGAPGRILTKPPSWARTFLLSTVMLKNDEKKLSWAGYSVRLKDGLTSPDTRNICGQLFRAYETKNIIIEHEPDMGDHPEEGAEPGAGKIEEM